MKLLITNDQLPMTSRKGFTLIELLVVIAIIGILASLAMVSYSGAQKQARDSQRRSDLAQYRNALENFASAHNSFYIGRSSDQILAGSNVCENPAAPLLPDFISSCPDDPITTNHYRYIADTGGGTATATAYVIWADLETGDYWVICSTGQVGEVETVPNSSVCPL